MKQFWWLIILSFTFGCSLKSKQPIKYREFIFSSYSWRMNDTVPYVSLRKFLKIESNGSYKGMRRLGYMDPPIYFSGKINNQVSEILNEITFKHFERDYPSKYDGASNELLNLLDFKTLESDSNWIFFYPPDSPDLLKQIYSKLDSIVEKTPSDNSKVDILEYSKRIDSLTDKRKFPHFINRHFK